MPDTFAVRDFANTRNGMSIDKIQDSTIVKPGFYCYDLTAVIGKGTYKAAYDAVQVALTGADILVDERESCVFALCRPPGSFCLICC